MKKTGRRLLPLLMALVMVLSVAPPAYAAGDMAETPEGTVTEEQGTAVPEVVEPEGVSEPEAVVPESEAPSGGASDAGNEPISVPGEENAQAIGGAAAGNEVLAVVEDAPAVNGEAGEEVLELPVDGVDSAGEQIDVGEATAIISGERTEMDMPEELNAVVNGSPGAFRAASDQAVLLSDNGTETQGTVQTGENAGIHVEKYNEDTNSTSEVSMFKVTSSSLEINGETMTVTMSIKTKTYSRLTLEGQSGTIQGTAGTNTAGDAVQTFTFTLPVSSRGTYVPVTLAKADGTAFSSYQLYMSIPDADGNVGGAPLVDVEEPEVVEDADIHVEKYNEDTNSTSEVSMFKVTSSSLEINGETMTVTMSIKTKTYSRLTLEGQSGTIQGTAGTNTAGDAVQTFTFTLPVSSRGTYVPVTLAKADGTAFSSYQLYMSIPDADGNVSGDPIKDNGGGEDPGTGDDPSTPEETIEGADIKCIKEDGTEYGMFKIVNSSITVHGDTMTVSITTQAGHDNYSAVYIGTDIEGKNESDAIVGTLQTGGGRMFTFDMPSSARGSNVAIRIWNTNTNNWVERTVYLSIPTASGEDPGTGDDPGTGTNSGSGDTPIPTPTPGTNAGAEGGNGSAALSDGTYTTTVTSSAAMFKVVNCELTVVNGQITAQITLSGTGYDTLYMGTAAAAAGDSAHWISPDGTANYPADDGSTKTGTVFTIPVSALDTPISVAAHGSKWYDRTLTFNSADLQKTSGTDEEQTTPGATDAQPTDSNEEPTTPAEESRYESDLSGATAAVDNSTTLADGVYTPDSFSWSGGTGRLTISCTQVTVRGGKAYATLVFSSTNMGYVKANGNIYYPTVSGGRSLFTIPVRLNANNTIIGMTTAMSAAHEVAYNIYVYIAAAAASDRGEGVNTIGFGDTAAERTLDDEAPEILGFVYDADNENEVAYAETFRLFYYDQGVRLLEVDMTAGTARDPELVGEDAEEAPEAEEAVSEEAEVEEGASSNAEDQIDTEIYMDDVVYYLMVPEDVEVPAGLEKEVVIITIPAENVYASSEEAMAALESLDLLDLLAATDQEPAEAEDGDASNASDEAPAYAGSWNDLNFRELIRADVKIALVSGMILPRIVDEDDRNADNEDFFYEADGEDLDAYFTGEDGERLTAEEQTDRMAEITEYFATLGIPVIVDRSADEETDLAAAEWIKVYGVLFAREDEANAMFGEAVEAAIAAGQIEAPETDEAA